MALGSNVLPLLLWLRLACLAQVPIRGEHEEVLISAPPELTALIPAAAAATVAAGYVPGEQQTHEAGPPSEGIPVSLATVLATAEGIPVSPAVVLATAEGSHAPPSPGKPGKPGILIMGDTRYHWQDWSPWHCNCAQGSMSRVRDITYAVPGVALDPAQYDVLRFQRVVCDYKVCPCLREAHQCDRLQVTCDAEEEHVCALRDIEEDQHRKRKDFWARLHAELKNLWRSLKDAFPRARKETEARSV